MLSYNISNTYSRNNNSYPPPPYQPQTQPNQYQPNIYTVPMVQQVEQPVTENSVIKPIPVDIPQQTTLNASYQQYIPSQIPQVTVVDNSLNQSLLPNNQPQSQNITTQFPPTNYPMNAMPVQRNHDQRVTLTGQSTRAYCSNCNSVIQTRVRSPLFFVIFTICLFMSLPLIASILCIFAIDYIPFIMPILIFTVFILFIVVFIVQMKAMHYCPRCNKPIGRIGQTVHIPASANRL